MTQLYFQYSNNQKVISDRRGSSIVGDLTELRDRAELVVRALVAAPGPEDWRSWVLHVTDDLGAEILTLPFASVLGRPH